MNVFDILMNLSRDNSRLYKEEILKQEFNNELLKSVLVATYNPFIKYYIKKIPEYSHNSLNLSLKFGLTQLELLSNRTLTGNAGITHLKYILSSLSINDAIIIELIIKGDLECGISGSTINKVWKNLIPDIPYMRISLIDKMKNVDWSKGLYSQLKADSLFANVQLNLDGTVDMFTRTGNPFDTSKFENIVKDIRVNFPIGQVYHGELQVMQDDKILPRELGNGILNTVAAGGDFPNNTHPVYDVWDMVSINKFLPKGKSDTPYNIRYEFIESYTRNTSHVRLIETKLVYSLQEAMEHYSEQISKGLEGTILKLQSATWGDKTSTEMWKLKLKVPCELEITGFNTGSGRNAGTFGSMACRSSDGLLVVDVNGRTDAMREEFWTNRDNLIGKIVSVESNAIMFSKNNNKPHSLFLPIFLELREDKIGADSFDKIKNQFTNIVNVLQ